MFDWLKNATVNRNRYKTHSEAVIVACFYNHLNSPYRLLAFQKWYRSIKHLNHRIVECLIGKDAKPQLPKSPFISQIKTDTLLWHKEALLNRLISDLPPEFKYVFWLDTDVLFTNPNWLVEGVEKLQSANIIQPFDFCVHLKKNQIKPDFNLDSFRATVSDPSQRHPQLWRSFSANYHAGISGDKNYDRHGHVGFAWGARRDRLKLLSLYDKALIGGADHIIAHAAAGQIPHECITKSFTENLTHVEDWSRAFYSVMRGKIDWVHGDLYHIWHGEVKNRQYLKRIRDFTPETKQITQKDAQGLYVKTDDNSYMEQYFLNREVPNDGTNFGSLADDFESDMGYNIWEIIKPVQLPSVRPLAIILDLEDDGSKADAPNHSSPSNAPTALDLETENSNFS